MTSCVSTQKPSAWLQSAGIMTAFEFRHVRKYLELTQSQLSLALGLSRDTINRYESGRYEIPRAVELALNHLMREKNTRHYCGGGGTSDELEIGDGRR